ncbi:uncharacterized protein LOC110009066 isoform X2 [Jatropha curcas]|uniref:uncharacterized protein LOC110009066 isoform X2 n=1 Tax=Jatropha curcas TaxID=180498 RepID=UPI0009D7026E|nr:uncharacterized protein LOC110009066 isoform X2 [Jatropha curcas]
MVHDLALFGRDEAGNDAYHGSHGFRRVRTLSADTCIKAIRKAVTAGIFANACRLELKEVIVMEIYRSFICEKFLSHVLDMKDFIFMNVYNLTVMTLLVNQSYFNFLLVKSLSFHSFNPIISYHICICLYDESIFYMEI